MNVPQYYVIRTVIACLVKTNYLSTKGNERNSYRISVGKHIWKRTI